MDIEQLRFPVGKFTLPTEITKHDIDEWIDIIEAFPSRLSNLVRGLSEDQLEAHYRPGSWTIRQVVHHVADSHLNSYIRFKWTLTEERPTIKTYDQNLWSERPDARSAPIALSIELLTGLHKRWVYVLRGLTNEELNRTFIHPEMKRELNLKWLIGLYAWHCRHHYAHIELALANPVAE